MKKKLVGFMITALTFIAFSNIAAASSVTFHQPELPAKFKK
ncbi:cyclic lactone autoinducer peptide [Serpentinicella sp. ANB-PHB4]|nr:cyclic lactone autoinducer peptide [Serpentinicella sp. ANB-PHB4]MDR5659173.1 cyclic lactone autoinducer peptide [Serpentinicella sp. ANB-PHB4]